MSLLPVLAAAGLLFAADPYADAIAPSTTAVVQNGANALGAPDGRFATVSGNANSHVVFDLGAGEEGTGDLLVHFHGFDLAVQTTVEFLDGAGQPVSTAPLGMISFGAHTATVPNPSATPYRFVRIRAGFILNPLKFGVDAIQATNSAG
ncbi:hypothetical protein [Amycolatopsis magusensis]|uniref:hypothetical protein n=1 Tax=Amycolatopsis magusensis TaxID=882444 RepID=UPI0037AA8EB1